MFASTHSVRRAHLALTGRLLSNTLEQTVGGGKFFMIEYLSEPNLVYVLLLAGLLGFFLEFKSPGIIIPGVISAICFLIVFGIQTLPLNSAGVFAILGGFVALILELYVASFGLLAVSGVATILYGSHILFDGTEAPGVMVARPLIWTVGFTFSALALLFGSLIAKTQFHAWLRYGGQNKSLKLSSPDSGDLPGTLHLAEVIEAIEPNKAGKIFYKGTYWNATIADEHLKGAPQKIPGLKETTRTLMCQETVQVVGWSGLTAKVQRYQSATESDTHAIS